MLKEISFVIGSMIGPGIFFLPFNISKYGSSGILSLLLSSIFFLVLGSYFSSYPSPFYLIEKRLGKNFCFFIGWTYWVTSWLSSIVVINEISLYVSEIFFLQEYKILFEVLMLLALTVSNLFGIKNSLKFEIYLSFFKILPLIIMPFLFIFHGGGNMPIDFKLSSVVGGLLPTVWCFSGIETMGFVAKSKKTFMVSMIVVTLVYILNVFGVFYFFSSFDVSASAYSQIMQKIYGDLGGKILKAIVLIESISNLNSWILSSGLCAYDLSKKQFLPRMMSKVNNYLSPQNAIVTSSACLTAVIILNQSQKASTMIFQFTEVSCNLFLVFYAAFSLSCLMEEKSLTTFLMFIISLSICFASQNLAFSLAVISVIMICGIPVFLLQRHNQKHALLK